MAACGGGAPASPSRAGEGVGSDQAEDALLHPVGQLRHAVGELGAVLGDGLAARVDRLLDLAPALAEFPLDADARFADLALEPVAGGDATPLEASQLRLG